MRNGIETHWYDKQDIKNIIGEYVLDMQTNEIIEPYSNGRRLRFKWDGRRKKPFGLKEKLEK